MLLNNDNYYSAEANRHYVSVSQYKDFMGSLGMVGCEARAMAKLAGEWHQEVSEAMLIGSYVDSYFEGTLDDFKMKNPTILTAKGELKAGFKKAESIIERIQRDPLFMHFLSGEKQIIMTGEVKGIPVKIKMDSYLPGKAIVDLKVMADLKKGMWIYDSGKVNFVEAWGYYLQGAVYQEIVKQNTGQELPVFIAACDKKEYPDIEVMQLEPAKLTEYLEMFKTQINKIQMLKDGLIAPVRCENCDYCRHTKVLTKPIWSSELIGI